MAEQQPAEDVESLLNSVGRMDRAELIAALRRLRCDYDLDFTEPFLRTVSLERLRHIVAAAGLHARCVDSAAG